MSRNEPASDVTGVATDHDWLPELFEMARLSPDADLETVKSKMSALANQSGPPTRTKWNLLVVLQGLAVCLPLGWLLGQPVRLVGLAVFLTTGLLYALHWWLRARSMQKTWARARLVAEVARSLLATAPFPDAAPWRSLAVVPSLRPLQRVTHSPPNDEPPAKSITNYIENRIKEQEDYFADRKKRAEAQRKRFTRWTSWLLDLALALAFAGLVVVFTPAGLAWSVGGSLTEMALGSISIVILVALLLIQILRELQELNRRTARYAQQLQVLAGARQRLRHAETREAAAAIVADTEDKLLGEVLEWYFHAETAERFAELREPVMRILSEKTLVRFSEKRLSRRIWARVAIAGFTLLGIIVSRLPYIVVPAAATVLGIFYYVPQGGSSMKKLEDVVQLMAADDTTLFANSDFVSKSAHGYIVLAHGLWGRGILTGDSVEDSRNWMKDYARSLQNRMRSEGKAEPAICLVDWTRAALPSQFYRMIPSEKFVIGDIAAIRPQAYQVGDIAAFRLASIILQNHLPTDVPIHLIGHSAGGFIVTRLARRLHELGLVTAPSCFHVTILDTPAPDPEITTKLPEEFPNNNIDFYISSDLGGRTEFLRKATFPSSIYSYAVPLEKETSPPSATWGLRWIKDGYQRITGEWDAHRNSYRWYEKTIDHPKSYSDEGFNRSPFERQSAPCAR